MKKPPRHHLLRERVNRHPFRPFRLTLTNGNSFDLVDPLAVSINTDATWLHLFTGASEILIPTAEIATIQSPIPKD